MTEQRRQERDKMHGRVSCTRNRLKTQVTISMHREARNMIARGRGGDWKTDKYRGQEKGVKDEKEEE